SALGCGHQHPISAGARHPSATNREDPAALARSTQSVSGDAQPAQGGDGGHSVVLRERIHDIHGSIVGPRDSIRSPGSRVLGTNRRAPAIVQDDTGAPAPEENSRSGGALRDDRPPHREFSSRAGADKSATGRERGEDPKIPAPWKRLLTSSTW